MIQFNTCGYVSEENTAKQKANTHQINKNATQFYNWFRSLGGNLSFFDAENLLQKFEQKQPQTVFKTKPERVKKELNHKFNLS